jgi:hypothetical protein
MLMLTIIIIQAVMILALILMYVSLHKECVYYQKHLYDVHYEFLELQHKEYSRNYAEEIFINYDVVGKVINN